MIGPLTPRIIVNNDFLRPILVNTRLFANQDDSMNWGQSQNDFKRRNLMSKMNGYVLSDSILKTFAGRAAGYDKDNRFFSEDFEDLRKAGYLNMAVPTELKEKRTASEGIIRFSRRARRYLLRKWTVSSTTIPKVKETITDNPKPT